MNYKLKGRKSGYRYYLGTDGHMFVLRDSQKFPSYYVVNSVCKKLGIDERAFVQLSI